MAIVDGFDVAVVVDSAVKSIVVATATAYISHAAVIAALIDNAQKIACKMNTTQCFTCIPSW